MASATAPTVERVRESTERPRRAALVVLSTAELSPCTCPEFCERDHDRD
jgi:hypothetical protein